MASILQAHNFCLYLILLYAPVVLLWVIDLIFPYVLMIVNGKSWNKPVTAAWRAIIDITLIGGLKSETTENGRKRYSLYGYPVTRKYVRAIGTFAIALWLSLIATFWLNFIIEVTEECKIGVDCFFANTTPYNCPGVDGFNEAIQCYEFKFDFINGAGTAGGLLAISVTILYGQLSAQIWLEKKIAISKKKKHFKILSILLGIVPLILSIILLLLSVIKFVDTLLDRRFTAIPNYLNAFFYLLPILMLSSHPLYKNTRLSTDPEENSPGPDSYTLMEDGHESINDNYTEEQSTKMRAHTTI